MPYKSVRFVKMKLEILDDPRFIIDLNDHQKLVYLLLLALAGRLGNAIPSDLKFISSRIGVNIASIKDLEHISKVFPKFKLNNGLWSFDNFDNTHNFIKRDKVGTPDFSAQGKEGCSKNRIDKNRIDKNKDMTSHKMALPLKDEVVTYFVSLGGSPDQATEFFEFYGSKGWVVGKSPMKNWKMAASRWHRRNAPTPTTQARPVASFLKPISTYGSLRGEG